MSAACLWALVTFLLVSVAILYVQQRSDEEDSRRLAAAVIALTLLDQRHTLHTP